MPNAIVLSLKQRVKLRCGHLVDWFWPKFFAGMRAYSMNLIDPVSLIPTLHTRAGRATAPSSHAGMKWPAQAARMRACGAISANCNLVVSD